MKKVVLFNIDLSGGAGKFIITLAQALAKKGVNVHIVIIEEETDYPIPSNVTLHILKAKKTNKSSLAKALKEYIEEIGGADLIFSNSTPSNKILSLLKLPDTHHIVHSAETKNYRGFLGFLKSLLRKNRYKHLYNNKKLITVSKGLQEYITQDLRAKPETIQTIYNPFDIDLIRSLGQQNLPEIPNEPFILHIGRLDLSSKRHDILLKAYKKANPPYRLYIVGEGEDRSKIQALINRMNLNERVILQGYTDNPYAWMKRAKLLVLSSDFEGYGRVLAEALIVGTPAVSTDCPSGPSEILTGPLKEYLSPPGDADALASIILKALSDYPDITLLDFSHLSDKSVAQEYIKLLSKNHKKVACE
jgi:glycosyltransferase involved in cell wall biosynthesis